MIRPDTEHDCRILDTGPGYPVKQYPVLLRLEMFRPDTEHDCRIVSGATLRLRYHEIHSSTILKISNV